MGAQVPGATKVARARLIRGTLLRWWRENGQRYPWRETRDPYEILVAELLLHRTQARQVVEVYPRFIGRYPTVNELADANPTGVVELTRPLGLRWRSTLIVELARKVVEEHNGRIPSDLSALKELPGVSDYIAGATRCFAWGHPEPILDTNIVRILGRLVGVRTNDTSRRDPKFRELAAQLIDLRFPRESNWALLDLGAKICKSAHPMCDICPIRAFCTFGRSASSISRTQRSPEPTRRLGQVIRSRTKR